MNPARELSLPEQFRMSDSIKPSAVSLRIDGRKLHFASLVTAEGCLMSIFDPSDSMISVQILLTHGHLTTLREQLVAAHE